MKLFLGFLFILMDLPVTAGGGTLDLLPDAAGYFLVMKALDSRDDPWRHGAFALLLASGVLLGADLFEKGAAAELAFAGLGLAAEVGMLALLWHTVRGTDRLRALFPVLACVRVLSGLLGWVPLVGSVCAIAAGAVSLGFLAAAWKPMTK